MFCLFLILTLQFTEQVLSENELQSGNLLPLATKAYITFPSAIRNCFLFPDLWNNLQIDKNIYQDDRMIYLFFRTIFVPSTQPDPELPTEPKSMKSQFSPVNTIDCLLIFLPLWFFSLFLLFLSGWILFLFLPFMSGWFLFIFLPFLPLNFLFLLFFLDLLLNTVFLLICWCWCFLIFWILSNSSYQ